MRRCGGIGRRTALKMRRETMPVRVRPPAPRRRGLRIVRDDFFLYSVKCREKTNVRTGERCMTASLDLAARKRLTVISVQGGSFSLSHPEPRYLRRQLSLNQLFEDSSNIIIDAN